ncbi:hypothetical protein ACFQI7_14700 [Paenibacillus allorhizosphaerae]|uniref:23S rRNA (Guanine(2535)-N(1))-methyltransferase n=1 Tax=Paenibacillus allorhizosphaerae TaxID=2849866 RepID=A0ABN7TE34_9BACL|nr:hypothetical protein [Paenibacillus allorhizosphaerae]CAG7627126.1 23S rRNA (guanine(2535)-N(1))-methyltransferase [Paenibacillus allorhizosphaerae]
MSYRFSLERNNQEDLASGRVLYNQHGATAFPVRLASEIFQWIKQELTRRGNAGPYHLYDPCCGGGYLLTSLGFLHGDDLHAITASDVNPAAVELAERNLSLLTQQGMEQRIGQIRDLYEQFGKPSHKDALESAVRLAAIVDSLHRTPIIDCFEADATKPLDHRNGKGKLDMIITDVPYGNIVDWNTAAGDPVKELLDHAVPMLAPVSLVAIVSSKEQKIAHDGYNRAGHWKLGKRRITVLELKTESPS